MSLGWDFELILDGPPHGKGRPRFSRATGHTYTPEKTARFEERLAWAAQSVMNRTPLFDGPLEMAIGAYFSIPASKPAKWKADAKNGRHVEVRRVIKDKVVYHKVFDVLAPRYKERPGGFTRILQLGQRKGDAAQIALVKLV